MRKYNMLRLNWGGAFGAIMVAAMSLAACGDGGTATPTPAPEPEPEAEGGCTPGFLGCECIDGTACFPGSNWVCLDGACREPVCEQGTEGCVCFANNTCDIDAEGEPMLCDGGLCKLRGCDPGTVGCECLEGRACGQGLACQFEAGRDICAPDGCEPGAQGCPCGQGRVCDPGLACAQGACVASSCRPGSEDCFCRSDLGCDEGLACGEDERCLSIPCTPGSTGCQCNEGGCAAPDALCRGGACERVDCPSGAEGCACINGTRCVVDGFGEQLFCEAGVCRGLSCAPGDVGCGCVGGVRCDEGGACVDGVCRVADCAAGTLHCGCAGGLCESGLRCREDDVCVDGAGFINNPCAQGRTCERGSRCTEADVCRRCTLGVPGCGCDDGGNCLVGAVCLAGTCVAEADVPPQRPEGTPRCYTHCAEGAEINGQYVECGPDGLMEACLGGRQCREGSCVFSDDEVVTCGSELDCPHWQTCIEGLCMSECKDIEDCSPGKQCHDHICRVPCEGEGVACPRGQHCATTDGESGFCLPNHPAEGEEIRRVPGGFAVSATSLEFSNTQVTQRFAIFNDSPSFQNFRLVRRRHLLQFADGTSDRATRAADGRIECVPGVDEGCVCDQDNRNCACQGPGCVCTQGSDCEGGFQCHLGACRPASCTAGTCPLFWMRIGQGRDEPVADEEIEVGVVSGGTVEVTLTDAASMNGVRYQATLDIVNPRLGTQSVDIVYNEVPEGQWAGEMVYLADFNDKGLEPWRVNQQTRNTVEHEPPLANALLRLWVAFRNGRISHDEMEAILTSIQSGSWKFPNVVQGCRSQNGACYPYDIGTLGLETLTSDLAQFPVPSGVVELPFGMNLRSPDSEGDPGLMVGRIASDKALHYAGSPSVSLRFLTSPQSCDMEAFGTCVAWIEDFEADILVGGRYLTTPDDTSCAAERDTTYAHVREPWLVPGFLARTELDVNTGQRYRYECRDSRLPFSSPDASERERLAPSNLSLALSNPVPDGRARRRKLKIIDGALINQSQMVIIFEERFDSFLGDDTAGFTAHGVMRLRRRATDLDAADVNNNEIADIYEGSEAQDDRIEPEGVLAPQCSGDILGRVLGSNTNITQSNLPALVSTLIDGVPSGITAQVLNSDSDEQVHFFCEETGLFDGGPENGTPPFIADLLPNDNSCGFSSNGTCEDGGPGSDFGVCALGTDRSDCGDRTDDDLDVRVECPVGSRVEFFTVSRRRMSQSSIAEQPCQLEGTCQQTLNLWKQSGIVVQQNPRYKCADPNAIFCDDQRQDLRRGKVFFAATESRAVFVQLPSLIDEAFRYKTRFVTRQGQNIGFSPDICEPGSDARPYCYDPAQIEEIEARIDCLLHIHQERYDDLRGSQARDAARRQLDSFFRTSFSQTEERRDDLSTPIVHDGFERQLAQLQIMLGDESFTRAFASRFDLDASSTASFEGALFEPRGINLSGAAGFEMFSLYQAAQTYQMVLDRFYGLSPVIWEATRFGVSARNFVTADTVLRYLDRVVRASTQKARTWGEIAKRYQALGRPDLARSVAERAYTATYLESVVMSRMMFQILEGSTLAENRGQIERAIEDSQLRYKVALVDMQNAHSSISDNLTNFGFEPDFVPFPALDAADFRQSNAFEVLLLRARNKLQFAREREDVALNQSRDFELNQAQFQSELTQVRNNFENQLADLCGTFVVGGEDADPNNDQVLPAIKKYAHLNDQATLFSDPCGQSGNGQIFQTRAALEDTALDARVLQVQVENVLEEVEIERERVSAQCGEILEAADFLYGKCERSRFNAILDDINPFEDPDRSGCLQVQINDLQSDIRGGQFVINRLQQTQAVLSTSVSLTKCSVGTSTDCPTAVASLATFVVGTALTEVGISATEIAINAKEGQIAELERFKMKWQTRNECDLAKVESAARVRNTLLRLRELDLESLRLEHRTRLALSEVQRLSNQARRLEAQQIEAEQLSINVQVAHSNPNVRIFKNDAIINAEIAFDDAIREVYKLTKVFEYYTSQSYANKNDLFLIRMVSRGDKNLENYVNELENTFFDFEEFFGIPSNRVHIVSLKNDILAVPFSDEQGRSLSDSQRTSMMRQRLTDPGLLDSAGSIALPFSTHFEQLSPLTRNHKILYVEADIYGSDTGDLIGRVYLRQKGTGVIKGVNDDRQFFRFDERTSVINAIFGGVRFFESTIYQNGRLRDRPFVNTQWELVINQRDESVNQDINLNALTDVRVNIYYTDFTIF